MVLDQSTYRVSGRSLEISGDQEVAIDLTAGEIKGRVVSAGDGAPVAGATVTLAGAAPGVPAALVPKVSTAPDGTFTIGPVVVGAYQVTVAKEGLEAGAATVTVEPHATAQLLIEIPRPAASGHPPQGG